MDTPAISQGHPTGDLCPGCDCEPLLVVTQGDIDLCVECECGRSSALAPVDISVRAA